VDNYEFKSKDDKRTSDYEYITQSIPETPLSETVFKQLNQNNDNVTKNDVKTITPIKEEVVEKPKPQEEHKSKQINNNGNLSKKNFFF